MIATYTFLSIRWMKQHWFKILLLVIFLLVLWKKEVSFGIHFNTPTSVEEPAQSQQVRHTTKKKFYTEDTKAAQEQSSLSNKFEQIRLFKKRKPTTNWENLDKQAVDAYLERFAKVAQVESRKFSVPASIILASGLVCSQAGQANYAQQGNNHFRLLCSENWTGETQQHEGKCFRHYDKAWSSYRDFSLYLTTGKQVGLLALEKQDYRGWAKALERLNSYSDINLSKQLISLIEEFHLQQLDTE
jgi:flagellum-specific peptidoglycan hydrolase FlgJ